MEPYIKKSAVVAEIERRITAYQKNFDKADNKIARISTDGRIQSLKSILSFINTLEVKGVDFDTEWKRYFEHRGEMATVNIKHLAKYFFELALQVAQKGEEV